MRRSQTRFGPRLKFYASNIVILKKLMMKFATLNSLMLLIGNNSLRSSMIFALPKNDFELSEYVMSN